MRYLLDTNAWLRWFHRPHELADAVRQLLNGEESVGLSPMSIVEVAQKHHKGKLLLPAPLEVWVANSLPKKQIKILPISPEVALQAYAWPEDFHGDPADHLIAATAVRYGLIPFAVENRSEPPLGEPPSK